MRMKKKILICINELNTNSIGISLINLLNTIDFTNYSVDLIYVKGQSSIINQIPSSVNVISSPFNTSNIKLMFKVKYFHKYNLSIMYDLEDVKLCELVQIASKNNYIYIHKNYRSLYVVKSSYDKFINDYKVLKFNNFIFANDLLKDRFLSEHPTVPGNKETLSYLIDERHINILSKEPISADKPNHTTLFVTMGTLNDRSKNYTLMIKMMKNLVQLNNHVALWILGDGPDLVNLKMLVKENNLDNYITLFGFKNNPYPYVAMADYYLNTSDEFDSSTALIEARVLRKPIITINELQKSENIHVVSSDPNKIANDVNNIILNKIGFVDNNNFWAENQHILKKFESLIK